MSQRVADLERQCWANAQYSRRECLEVAGIPRSVDDNSLEEKLIQVFEKVGCSIEYSNIEVCHRITKKNDRVIVKFSNRKDWQRVLSVKKNLKKLKMEDIGLTGDNKGFINHSLCPYYCVLWSKLKVLFKMRKINRLMISNGTVKVKISEISAPISITHADNLQNISLILIYLSSLSLVKASNLPSCVILQNTEFFSFNVCYRVLGFLSFF